MYRNNNNDDDDVRRIVDIWRTTKGTRRQKADAICAFYNLHIVPYRLRNVSVTQREYSRKVHGCTNGTTIWLRQTSLYSIYGMLVFFHEVGHCLLHIGKIPDFMELYVLDSNFKRTVEREADEFADTILCELLGRKQRYLWYAHLIQ